MKAGKHKMKHFSVDVDYPRVSDAEAAKRLVEYAERHGTGRETHADPRDCATTLLRVKIPLVPSDARTVAEGTGGAR